jgi:hypothetical protein
MLPNDEREPRDYDVYLEPRCGGPRGLRRIILPFRWVLVRLLRPVFQRLAALLRAMDADQQDLTWRQKRTEQQVDALLNSGWDQASALRRISYLERQVDDLTRRLEEMEGDGTPGHRGYFSPAEEPAPNGTAH